MKVFISWSGDKSRLVAEALRDWLQDVIQALDPWVSASDIEKGARWHSDISSQLEQSQIGIICLTRDNMNSAWLLFESGALSKINGSYVCTFLIDVEPLEVKEPLAQFQSTRAEKGDVLKLLHSINRVLKGTEEKAPSDQQLERLFERSWPEFDKVIRSIPKDPPPKQDTHDMYKMLEEIVGFVRAQTRTSRSRAATLDTGYSVPPHLIHEATESELMSLERILNKNPALKLIGRINNGSFILRSTLNDFMYLYDPEANAFQVLDQPLPSVNHDSTSTFRESRKGEAESESSTE